MVSKSGLAPNKWHAPARNNDNDPTQAPEGTVVTRSIITQ